MITILTKSVLKANHYSLYMEPLTSASVFPSAQRILGSLHVLSSFSISCIFKILVKYILSMSKTNQRIRVIAEKHIRLELQLTMFSWIPYFSVLGRETLFLSSH